MNFLSLKYFLVVTEEMNITRAAKRLYISQQSLSAHIRKLETEFGVELFERAPSLRLTFAGEKLAAQARKILAEKDDAERELADIGSGRRRKLTIGMSYTRGRAMLPEILPLYVKQYPLVEIHVVEGNTAMLEKELAEGGIDLLVGGVTKMDHVSSEMIAAERLFLVVPQAFSREIFGGQVEFMRGKCSEAADLQLFSREPFILLKKGNRVRTEFDELQASLETDVRVLLESENIETLFELALRGLGITVYRETFLRTIHADLYGSASAGVDFFPLSGIRDDPILITYDRERYLPEAAKNFIRIARETAPTTA